MTERTDPFTLFEISGKAKAIISDIIDAEIAGDADEVNALVEELDDIYGAREAKHEGYVHVIKNALTAAEGHKAEADAFAARARALNNLAKRLKERLVDDLQSHDESVVNAGIFKIARQRNSQPSVVLDVDAEDLPEAYQKVTVEADKDALKYAINAGEVIDGVNVVTGEHIRIRVK